VTPPSLNDQLVLYWVVDHGDPVPLGNLLASLERNSDVYWQIRFECVAAAVGVPTRDEVLGTVQKLLDSGYLTGWWSPDPRTEPRPIANVALLERFFGTSFVVATPAGEKHADQFALLVNGPEGRARRSDFVNYFVQEQTKQLTFEPQVPKYLPDDVEVVPEIEVDDLKQYVKLSYWGTTDEFVGPRIILHQSTTPLARDRILSERTWGLNIRRTRISATEHHVTSNWARLILSWTAEHLHYKAEFQWSAPSGECVDIDEDMRNASKLMVRSMFTREGHGRNGADAFRVPKP
jgi:hypothetical protein